MRFARWPACLLSLVWTLLLLAAAPARSASAEAFAYVTNQGDGVSVIDLATLKVARTIDVGRDPRGLGITPDGHYLVTANQADANVSVVDIATGKTLHRIAVGKNAEFVRIGPDGRFAYVTYEPSSTGKPPGKGEGDKSAGGKSAEANEEEKPAEIAVIDLSKSEVAARLPASPETEGMDFSLDGHELVVANEGDNTVAVYDLHSGRVIKRIDVSSYGGNRPRGVKRSPDGTQFLVTLENSDNFLVLDSHYEVLKTIATGKGPYGVAFGPDGATVWIAAARSQKLEVLDAKSFAPLASIPVGKRCWHFSFSPDGAKALVACGRSDDVVVVDVAKREPITTLTGFHEPWGIVTYPQSSGSLETPH
ncbi:MAG: beta-propeller fold lactonase family protein [Burkholderiaceae bacterium]|nr:beta-propeller fold lactonase family protein [Burkholderiaceae bacterium]